ncbi:metal-dependent hydrolase [Methanotorris formicicus]|uniref:Membrane-bound metal-dependent hydrolase n=1 Tax=Methanotorris formicicus Mc-S-70 TaxID=647171 RepID=H1KZT6_9EURY|nr:metal-dependent hydrolase [Methanotorris formicicus]EHP85542.1 hypothetical protein MetfoDRAFT_1310 [Methanotorris formicicus Mc-S-70]
MDILTHVFIPLIFLFAIRELKKEYVFLIPFTLFPDLDKFIGTPLLHSLVVEFGVFLVLFGTESFLRKKYLKNDSINCKYSMIIMIYILSHLVLDFFDGGPVYLFYPFLDVGVGLEFSTKLVVGNGFEFKDVLPNVVCTTPHRLNEYGGVISGFGVVSMLMFLLMMLYEYRFNAIK